MTVDEMPNDKKTYDINSCAVSIPTAGDGRGPPWRQRSSQFPQLLTVDYVFWIAYFAYIWQILRFVRRLLAYIWQVFVRKVPKTYPLSGFSRRACAIYKPDIAVQFR